MMEKLISNPYKPKYLYVYDTGDKRNLLMKNRLEWKTIKYGDKTLQFWFQIMKPQWLSIKTGITSMKSMKELCMLTEIR